ncbi:hypothetical protein B0H17DRAFT_917647 [Mycena rosella]|uniref:Uncharacterized protein n=1 Tax=Mycena rosella TaxID=1033263 RepID=A0AAD7GXN7_MYCRO|nr:hypothetical protein B0H17DRAFT_917647 [Mycena rosella]
MLQWHSKEIAVGLPPKRSRPRFAPRYLIIHVSVWFADILNRLNRAQPKHKGKGKGTPAPYVDPDPRKQMDDARHLAKYVFARQYNLASPFKFTASKWESFKLPNFNDREAEIKVLLFPFFIGTFKTPKRLKEVIPLLEKMIWRHGKCGYEPLRDHACPSKVSNLRLFSFPGIMSICSIRSKHSSARM